MSAPPPDAPMSAQHARKEIHTGVVFQLMYAQTVYTQDVISNLLPHNISALIHDTAVMQGWVSRLLVRLHPEKPTGA